MRNELGLKELKAPEALMEVIATLVAIMLGIGEWTCRNPFSSKMALTALIVAVWGIFIAVIEAD